MSGLFDLTGKLCVVTGGAGILGMAFSRALAEAGATVALVDLSLAASQEAVARLQSEGAPAGRITPFACDVSDVEAVAALRRDVEATLGDTDALFNNAASKSSSLEGFFAPFESYSLETWREVMAVNLDGAFLMAQAFGSAMARRGRGSIIQIASIYGAVAPDQRIYEGSEYLGREINSPAVYSASKAGLIGLTMHLASLWGAAGVRVNAISPGGVQSGQNRAFFERYSARVPLGRMATTNDMVGLAVFLASDASSYMTGQNLLVDGGLSVW